MSQTLHDRRTRPKVHLTNGSSQYCVCDPTIFQSSHRRRLPVKPSVWLMKEGGALRYPGIRLERCLTRSNFMDARHETTASSGNAFRNCAAAQVSRPVRRNCLYDHTRPRRLTFHVRALYECLLATCLTSSLLKATIQGVSEVFSNVCKPHATASRSCSQACHSKHEL